MQASFHSRISPKSLPFLGHVATVWWLFQGEFQGLVKNAIKRLWRFPLGANLLAAYTPSLANFAGRQSAGHHKNFSVGKHNLKPFVSDIRIATTCVPPSLSHTETQLFLINRSSFLHLPFCWTEPKTPDGNLGLLVLELQPKKSNSHQYMSRFTRRSVPVLQGLSGT